MPLSFDKIRELRSQRAKLAHDAQQIISRAEKANRAMSAEEEQRFDLLMKESDLLKETITREERLLELDAELTERTEIRSGIQAGDGLAADSESEHRSDPRYSRAFRSWLRAGAAGLDPESRYVLANGESGLEHRTLGTVVGTAGGYLAPEDFARRIETAMKAHGGMRASGATILPTENGNKLPMPTSDDTAQEGVIVAENSQVAELDATVGQVVLGNFMYSSKIVRVSIQLLQDSAVDVEAFLAKILGERIFRVTNRHFTVGTGAAEPQGVVTAATLGKTAAAAAAITYSEIVDLEHSVDPAYRNRAAFMFHDDTLKAIKKLTDSDGRPLWLPGVALRQPDKILGYNYVVNQDMPQLAAGNKTIAFGDFSKYVIRDVRGITLVQFREKYMDYLQVGFMAFSRHDGALLDAGTAPIKYLQQA